MLDTGKLDTGADDSTVSEAEEIRAEETGVEVGSVETSAVEETALVEPEVSAGMEVESPFEETEDFLEEEILLKKPEKAELISERISEEEAV